MISSAMLPYRHFRQMLSIQAKAAAEKPFLILPNAGGEALSYAEFNARVHQTAHLLHSDLGLRRGDPLGVMGAVDADLLVIVCAAWVVGLTVYPLRSGRPAPQGCRVVIAQAEVFDPALAPTVIQVGGRPRGDVPFFHDMVRGLPNTFYSDEAEPALDDAALAVASIGEGGRWGQVSMRGLLNGALRLALAQGSLGGQRVIGTAALDDLASLSAVILMPLLTGGTVTLLTAFEPGTFWRRVAADRIHSAMLSPAQVEACIAYAQAERSAGRPIFGAGVYQQDVRGFRHVLSAGLTREQAAGFSEIYGLPILHGYCDEALGGFTCLLPLDLDWVEQQRWLRGGAQPSVGVPLAGVEVEPPQPGQRGTIRFRADGVERLVEGSCEVDARGRRFYFIEAKEAG
ncbi:MAG: AMP-binding protein [Anaerolineae bacterium]|nr:AMP-binding protein [Anaerolineae bacterium]